MQVVSTDEVVPDAVPISLMQRATVAPIGFWRNPPAGRCPVAMAVTAVAPAVTDFRSRVMLVRGAGGGVGAVGFGEGRAGGAVPGGDGGYRRGACGNRLHIQGDDRALGRGQRGGCFKVPAAIAGQGCLLPGRQGWRLVDAARTCRLGAGRAARSGPLTISSAE